MPTFQSKNVNTITAATPDMAGEVYSQVVQYAITAAYATATDVIEVAVLPARTKLTSVEVMSSGITAAATIDVGFLTGTYGDKQAVRTSGNGIVAAAAKNVTVAAPIEALFAIAAAEVDRGIGIKLSANEAAGAGKITLRMNYQAA